MDATRTIPRPIPFFTRLLLAAGLLLGGFPLAPQERVHTVAPEETLFGLALRYGVELDALKEANRLDREMIRAGEELIIPAGAADVYKVKPGDTLSQIAQETGITLSRLESLNRIKASELRSGTELQLVRPPYPGESYLVRPGDSLSWISLKFDTSQARLRQINELESDALREGQILRLTPSRPQSLTIQRGDSLWAIAARYELPLETLRRWNGLEEGSPLLAGGTLRLYPTLVDEEDPILPAPRKEAPPAAPLPDPEVKLAGLGFAAPLYFASPTERRTQPSRSYAEEELDSPWENYRRAAELREKFDRAIGDLPPLSRSLEGYRIVLDPGHGGLDPGAIVESTDGRGNKVYVVEDEYCYDIALRVYKDLRRHGAEVFLTVISPDHTIRRSPDASLTFVNEKNEVWNEQAVNKQNRGESWPLGSRNGLNKRVDLAEAFFREAPAAKSLFVSIHADNQPYAGPGTIVLYHPQAEGSPSEELAEFLTGYLGRDSSAHSQELRVLKANPADAAVLVEVRNLAYPNNSWAIRNEELRQDDADRIVKGLVAYAARP